MNAPFELSYTCVPLITTDHFDQSNGFFEQFHRTYLRAPVG